MKIIKRSGEEVEFNSEKILVAVTKANETVASNARLSEVQIKRIVEDVEIMVRNVNRALHVEEIQDMVENLIMNQRAFEVARHYITYRYTRELARKANTTDDKILSLIELRNEEAKQENANKNPILVSTQRDYMAGEVSKDLTRRILLPEDVKDAHDNGLIHVHDTDYFIQPITNCCLVNLEDMLQNGTVINGTLIEKPHSFSTACNIATQVVALVSSSQFGGQSLSLSHLAPFVDVSRKKIRKQIEGEIKKGIEDGLFEFDVGSEKYKLYLEKVTKERVKEEIKRGVQMIQYQVLTLMTTNGYCGHAA